MPQLRIPSCDPLRLAGTSGSRLTVDVSAYTPHLPNSGATRRSQYQLEFLHTEKGLDIGLPGYFSDYQVRSRGRALARQAALTAVLVGRAPEIAEDAGDLLWRSVVRPAVHRQGYRPYLEDNGVAKRLGTDLARRIGDVARPWIAGLSDADVAGLVREALATPFNLTASFDEKLSSRTP